MPAPNAMAVLEDVADFLRDQADVMDGPDGPLPDRAMSLLAEIEAILANWQAGADGEGRL